MNIKPILIASDHAGFELKQKIMSFLDENKIIFSDLGCFSQEKVDYPDYAYKLCKQIINLESEKGILICGSGIGMSIAANRFKEIRAALCFNPQMALFSREHNDANILVLGERIVNETVAIETVKIFLETSFSESENHQRRVEKLFKFKE